MKHIKRINILIGLMIAVIIGMIAAMASYGELNSIAWYWHILVFFLVFLVVIAFHELAHAIAFRVQGIKIKAIYILFISFIKKNKILLPYFNIHSLKLLGGLVVPEMPTIDNDKDFYKTVKKFKISIVAAPIASVVLSFILFIVLIILMLVNPGSSFNEIFITVNLYTLLLTLLVNISSSAEAANVHGDYRAYKRFKERDEIFSYMAIENYFIEGTKAYEESEEYMYNKLISILEKEDRIIPEYYFPLIISYLSSVIYDKKPRSSKVDEGIKRINISSLYYTEQELALAYLICSFYYIDGDIEKAFSLFEQIKKHQSKKIDPKVRTYFEKKQEHHFGLANNLEYLNDDKNIPLGIQVILEPVFHFKKQEKLTNIKLKPGIKVPEVYLFKKLPRTIVSGADILKDENKAKLFRYLL